MGMPLSRPSLMPAVLPPQHRDLGLLLYAHLSTSAIPALLHSHTYIPYMPCIPYMLYIKLQDAVFSRPALLTWQSYIWKVLLGSLPATAALGP